MELNKLRLKNFKGIKALELSPRGKDLIISGRNATGKTTVMDAFCWLLFGKDSQNKKDFEIKTLEADGQAISGLDHEVEAELMIDGKPRTLKKVYKETWTKKRGSSDSVHTGHTIDHFIDGVPVKQKEYDAAIEKIAPENVFRLLTDPRHFNTAMHWTDRRALLIEVCGDVPDSEVIASKKSLAKLPAILGDRDVEDHKKVIAAQKKEIQKELDRIPTRIDEVHQGLPATDGQGRAPWENALKIEQELIKGKEQRLAEIKSGGRAAELKARGYEIAAQIQKRDTELKVSQGQGLDQLLTEKNRLSTTYQQATNQVNKLKNAIDQEELATIAIEKELEELRDDWARIDAEQHDTVEGEGVCPTCGQDLPAEQIEAARQKAVENFNQKKARDLEAITASGQMRKKRLESSRATIIELKDALVQEEEEQKKLLEEAKELQEEIAAITEHTPDPAQDKELKRLMGEAEAARKEIAALENDQASQVEAIENEIEAHRGKINEAVGKLHAYEQRDNGLARIEELTAQERKLAKEYEALEKELFLTDEFIKAKVEMLEGKINGQFELARFKLFEHFISGGIEPTCETLYQGVPYGTSLNNGARINVGLDIIRTLSRHYKTTAPIFIDNAEAVNELIEMEAQVICLEVSDEKTLTTKSK